MKRVLLIPDVLPWAWGRMAYGIQKYGSDEYQIDILDQQQFFNAIRSRRDLRWDAVFQFSWYESTVPGCLPAEMLGRQTTLVASHGVDYLYGENTSDIRARIATKIRNQTTARSRLPLFDGVIAVNRKLAESIASYCKQSVYLLPGVDVEFFHPHRRIPANLLQIGWCGQVSVTDAKKDVKGYVEVLLPLILRMNLKCEFVLHTASAINAKNAEWMRNWFHSIDVLISTSACEGCQMPLLEAAACGVPLIATDVGAAAEVITEGRNGFLIPPFRTEDEAQKTVLEFESALWRFIRDRRLLKESGEASREIAVNKFSWKTRADDWLRFICP